MLLNDNAHSLTVAILQDTERLRIRGVADSPCQLLDFGDKTPGGLEAGRRLAEVCLAGLAEVSLAPGAPDLWDGPAVQVWTDSPVAACMASQYAGWEVKGDDFFAMGSGPMRAAYGAEELFETIGHRESPRNCVGVLEAHQTPPDAVCLDVAQKCDVDPSRLTLLYAPIHSQAGSVQVVARSVETALHKLHELGFDLTRVESGWGFAPLPPVAGDALTGIGRTNDALLYGGRVVLYVRGDDDTLAEIGPRTPSCASSEHGHPFKELFAECGGDFYNMDRMLFSPAIVTFVNLDTGRTHRFGRLAPKVLARSFES